MSELTQKQRHNDTIGPNEPARRLSRLWRQGQRPRVEEFLAQAGVTDPATIVSVLRVDQWERRRLGERVPAESYLDGFPAVRDDPERVIDVVFSEYLLREQLGESPQLSEYARRFPQYAGQLTLQVELHQAMQDEPVGPWPETWGPSRAVLSAKGTSGAQSVTEHESTEFPKIPGFEVLGVLGWGGMGMVYQAWQPSLNRMVALKMVHAGAAASPEVLARFRVEAEAVARLHHPNIVQIHEVGQDAGRAYLVLEFVEGPSLAQSLAGTPQTTQKAVELVETLARAMHSAHLRGVVHRDLTPANILLSADGTPKITDFGLAKLLIGGGELRTQTGELLGTPSYMAPEQAASRHHAIGAATDVYALGAILYDVLTGRPPFKAESPLETLRQVVADEPVAPSRLRPKLPRDLETICLKCLRKEPEKRYTSALALAEELRRFLEGRPILARPSTSAERFWRWCRRNPWLAAANIAAAALTTILAVGATVAAWTFRAQRDQIAWDSLLARRAATETLVNLFNSLAAQADARRFSSRSGQRFDSLAALTSAASIARRIDLPRWRVEPLRTEAIACMALFDLSRIKEWNGWIPGTVQVAFDADLERYARVTRDGSLSIRRVDDDHELLNLRVNGLWPRFSSDGRYLAVEDPRKYLEVWNLERKTKVAIYHDLLAWDFRPDSRLLAIGRADGSLIQHDLTTGQEVRTWRVTPRALKLAFSPDGRQLAVVTADPSILQIRDSVSGQVSAEGPAPAASDIAWHPDGRSVASTGVSDNPPRIYLWDVATASRKLVLEGPLSAGLEVAFSPAGDLLVSWGWEGRIRLWDSRNGKLLLSMTGYCHDPVFNRDGRVLAAHDEKIQMGLWQVASCREYRTLLRDTYHESYWKLAIHPGGRLLAAGTEAGVGLWDLGSGRELRILPIGRVRHLLFDPGGNLLTRGPSGVWRWPIQKESAPAALRVGPPRALGLPGVDSQLSLTPDGRLLALANVDSALLVDPDRPDHPIPIGRQGDMRYVALSPDGRWLATGSHHEPGVQVWDARNGKRAADLPCDGWSEVAFSPDGQWLAAGHLNCRIWSVGSWGEGPQIGGVPLGFSPDGGILAVETGAGVVRLVNPPTGRDYARLEDPRQERVAHVAFSPDGARLAVASQDASLIHVWDLRAIRRNLVTMNLDWTAPPYPELDPADPALPPLPPVVLDLGPFSKGAR
jgi:WD40 repeat protein